MPNSGRRISSAYVGLTVVTRSAARSPARRKLVPPPARASAGSTCSSVGEALLLENLVGEYALVADVVQREHARDGAARLEPLQHGHERRVPVVAMQHVGAPAVRRAQGDGGGGEPQEPAGIARVAGIDGVRRELAELEQEDARAGRRCAAGSARLRLGFRRLGSGSISPSRNGPPRPSTVCRRPRGAARCEYLGSKHAHVVAARAERVAQAGYGVSRVRRFSPTGRTPRRPSGFSSRYLRCSIGTYARFVAPV